MILSPEAIELLKEAAASDGTILKFKTLSGFSLTSNGKEFVTRGDPRSEAKWESIAEELISQGLIKSMGGKNEIYKVTQSGYTLIDTL